MLEILEKDILNTVNLVVLLLSSSMKAFVVALEK